ncbi:MAG: hypothetical protein QOD76_904 [Solirubrobacteraceae bacterium]|jgi:3D (Asp-Asp-Asp) domain-containing protein|nr:hypothetical protein [Solirubrobacteraceae bacterium]
MRNRPANPSAVRRTVVAVLALALLPASVAIGGTLRGGDGSFVWHALPGGGAPQARSAKALAKPGWLSGVRVTEYYPAPERWALGKPARTPGLKARHRIDWLYGAFGVSMEGTGIGLDGKLYHIESLGKGGWVTRTGKPTFDGVHNNGPPYWRAGGYWRNSKGGVTFRLLTGAWTNGVGRRWVRPPRGISFAPGPGTQGVRYWRTIAVDPALIPLGSRIYVPYYAKVSGATGWFTANDTGGAIKGRHVDVFRTPPATADDQGRNLVKQRIYVVPPGQTPGADAPPGR